MKVYINEKQGWICVGIILIVSILLGLMGIFQHSSDDLHFTLSAIFQGLAVFLTFFIIVIYNELRDKKQIITNIEKSVFNFLDDKIEESYLRWGDEYVNIDKIIDAPIDKKGFTNTYFTDQVRDNIYGLEVTCGDTKRSFGTSIESFKWKQYGIQLDETAVKKGLSQTSMTDIDNDYKKIEKIVSKCRNEAYIKQRRLMHMKEERNRVKQEFIENVQKIKHPIVMIGIIIGICIITMPYVSVMQKNFYLSSGILSFVILGSVFSVFWVLSSMYYLLMKQI